MQTKFIPLTFLISLIYIPTIFGQCGQPTALNVINITSNSASIAWTAPASSVILDYVVYVRLTNNAPISSTLPTASSTTTSALVNGLMPNTIYYYWVKATCTNFATSGWIAGGTFTTNAEIYLSCNGAFYGLFPSATYTPTCSGSSELITPSSAAGQYTNVILTANTQYIFKSSTSTDYLTITNAAGTAVLVKGSSPLTWNSGNFSGLARYFLHSQVACGISSSTRARSIQCVNLETKGFDTIDFSSFPNPTSGILNINYSKNISEIRVTNKLGQLLMNKNVNNKEITIDLTDLPNEIYFVNIISDGLSKMIKVIKE